jgi:hypothetical protein
LIVCRNAELATERARKRQDLLAATERDLKQVQAAVRRRREAEGCIGDVQLKCFAILCWLITLPISRTISLAR